MFGRDKDRKSYQEAIEACDTAIDKLKCVNQVLDQDPQIVIPLRSERRSAGNGYVSLRQLALGLKN